MFYFCIRCPHVSYNTTSKKYCFVILSLNGDAKRLTETNLLFVILIFLLTFYFILDAEIYEVIYRR